MHEGPLSHLRTVHILHTQRLASRAAVNASRVHTVVWIPDRVERPVRKRGAGLARAAHAEREHEHKDLRTAVDRRAEQVVVL
jgi:hypothetical protein